MAQCKTKYTTLLDLSRQAKIITGDTACFDGKIQTGIPFSGYPTGVDLSTVVETGVIDSQTAVFSGSNVTTVFDVANPLSPNYSTIFSGDTYSADTWSNPIFSADTSYLTLPITTLSADSQTTPTTWTLTQTGMTGDYVIGTQYTGYSVTYSFFDVEQNGEYTGTTVGYTGTTQASQISYSAQSLDYKGPLDYISSKENISVEGKLITNKLQVTYGADASTIGYVLKQSDSEGNVEWGPDTSGSTTSITDYSYDDANNTLTITLSDGSIESATINEMSGLTINNNLIVSGSTGIGTDTPTEKLHIKSTTDAKIKIEADIDDVDDTDTADILLSQDGGISTSNIGLSPDSINDLVIGVNSTTSPSIKFATRNDGTTFSTTADTKMTITNSGSVGVGTETPLEKLHVVGNILVSNNGGSGVITLSGSGVSDAAVNFDNTGSATPFSQIIGQTFGGGASGNIEFNTNPGAGLTKRMTISTAGRVGIGNINNNDIEEELHVYDGDFLIERNGGRFSTVLNNVSGPIVRLSADTSDTLISMNIASPNSGGIAMGARGLTEVGFPGYGKAGDGYLYSSNDQNGLNIISSAGAGLEDYIRMYAGQDAVGTADLFIHGTGATRGFVGIHTETPTTELDVNGDVNISGSLTVGSQVIGNTTTVDAAADPNVNGIDVVFYTASLGGGTIYLNSALNQLGYKVKLIRTSTTATADISGSGGALINGVGAKALPTAVYSTTTCVSDGTDWYCSNSSIL